MDGLVSAGAAAAHHLDKRDSRDLDGVKVVRAAISTSLRGHGSVLGLPWVLLFEPAFFVPIVEEHEFGGVDGLDGQLGRAFLLTVTLLLSSKVALAVCSIVQLAGGNGG